MNPNQPKSAAQLLQEKIDYMMQSHSDWNSLERRSILDEFYALVLNTDEATRNSVIKGNVKAFLKKLMNGDDAENVEVRVDLPANVNAAVQRFLVVIEKVNQANKSGTKAEQEEALNLGLMAVTDAMGDPDLADVQIKGEKLPKFLSDIVGSAPDECNNILSSTVKPHLDDLITGVPRVQRAKAVLGFK